MLSIFLVSLASVILQYTAVSYTRAAPPVFNLPLIVLVFYSLKKGPLAGAWLGIFFGLACGLLAISPLWFNVVIYTGIGFFVGFTGQWFYKEDLPAFLIMIFCTCLILNYSYLFRFPTLLAHTGAADYIFRLLSPILLCNIIASAFFFYLLRELKR